jgi:HPt (histidine-containing phosphotransfer) domain-containing protein/HAMP domain-containing protein
MRKEGMEDGGEVRGLDLLSRPVKAVERESVKTLLPLKESIRKKVFLSSAIQFGLVLGLVFSFVMALDLLRMRRSFQAAQTAIAKSIISKGKHQVLRTGMILAALPETGAPPLIREVIGATVASDPDILYGIFMDPDRKPLAVSRAGGNTAEAAGGQAAEAPAQRQSAAAVSDLLTDEMSLWAATAEEIRFRSAEADGKALIEFAGPVIRQGVTLGIVRFGVATGSMDAALRESRESWRKSKELAISLFVLLGLSAFLMAVWSSSVLAGRITRPIRSLTGSAIRIAQGDYRARIRPEGEDEIAMLAEAFEAMRDKVQGYTGNLQMLVDEKVRQVRDILDNVRQGLFTFNLDLNVNPDCSLSACRILGMDELAGHTLAEVLRLNPEEEALFRDWVAVVLMHYETHRWEKLANLAPVQEIRLGAGAGGKQIKAEYQKILDKQGRLVKIMVLIQDVTEARYLATRMREEKIRLENKVRTILGITSNPPEVVSEFLKDSAAKIEAMQQRLPLLNHPGGMGAAKNGNRGSGAGDGADFHSWIRIFYQDCHTIKGNAGAFGFEVLTELAHELETRLDNVARMQTAWPDAFPAMKGLIAEMQEEFKRMRGVMALLNGNSEEVYVRLPESKASRILGLAKKAGTRGLNPEAQALVECCKSISHRSFSSLTRKYQAMVSRVAIKTRKDISFSITPPELELDPDVLQRADEALIHLVRNAAVHGISASAGTESPEMAEGRIELAYSRTSEEHVFTVKDDGGGINPDAMAGRAVAAGILDREAAEKLDANGKLQLIFYPGFSTSDKPDSLSGRGMGLTIARESVRIWGGTITVASRPGQGSAFAVRLPLQ